MATAILSSSLDWPNEKLMAALDAEGIDSRPFFRPLSSLPAYDGQAEALIARKRNATSYGISPWGINLPSALCLTHEQVKHVAETLGRLIHRS